MSGESGDARTPSRGRANRWVIAAVSLVMLLLSGVIAIAAGTFDVDRVDFSGLHRVSYDEAYRAAGIKPGDFMGTLDADGAPVGPQRRDPAALARDRGDSRRRARPRGTRAHCPGQLGACRL